MPECTNGPPGIGMGIGPMTGQMPMGMHPGIMGMGIPPIGIGGMPPPMGGMAPGMPRMGGISGMGMNGMGGMGGIAPGVGGMWMTPYFERYKGPGWPQMSWGASPQEMNVPWGGQSGSFGPRGFGESRELEEEPGSPSTPVPRHRGHPELIVKRREAQQCECIQEGVGDHNLLRRLSANSVCCRPSTWKPSISPSTCPEHQREHPRNVYCNQS